MKLNPQRQLALAAAIALGGAAAAPAAYGWSVDVTTGIIGADSGADTLSFPIYTTAVGATTSISTTNTGDSTIAAKIRFREQEHSMDVLDFIVIYSPYDKFDFYVNQGDEERPTMRWTDNSCVVGPAPGGVQPFPPPSQFVSSNEVMSVGHVEILGMATLDGVCWDANNFNAYYVGPTGECDTGDANLGVAAEHDSSGEPANCGILTNLLSDPAAVFEINEALNPPEGPPLGDVPNDLIGRYVITDAAGGIEAGGDAIAIANSDLYLTAQSSAECVNCTSYYAWDRVEWDHPHLAEMGAFRLSNFQFQLSAFAVGGDWSNNPANFVGVDWIIGFPSKYAYLDWLPADQCNGTGTSRVWCLLATTKVPDVAGNEEDCDGFWDGDVGDVCHGNPRVWTLEPTENLCLRDVDQYIFNSEEQSAGTTVSVSPGSRTTLDICNETNILTLAAEGQEVRASVIQTPERREIVRFTELDAIRGWGALELSWPWFPGPAINGLNFTTRATADPAFNNGSITTLQKFQGD